MWVPRTVSRIDEHDNRVVRGARVVQLVRQTDAVQSRFAELVSVAVARSWKEQCVTIRTRDQVTIHAVTRRPSPCTLDLELT